jgi:hypothetical protein
MEEMPITVLIGSCQEVEVKTFISITLVSQTSI